MNNQSKVKKLLDLFIKLKNILILEGDDNWIRGIDLIIDALSTSSSSDNISEDAVKYAENTYKTMLGGNGSFSDFFIWREDFDERKRENKKLDDLKSAIWDAFDYLCTASKKRGK